jgi:hypothetical protein
VRDSVAILSIGSVASIASVADATRLGRAGHAMMRESHATTLGAGSSTGGARKLDVCVTVTSRVRPRSPDPPREIPQPLAP